MNGAQYCAANRPAVALFAVALGATTAFGFSHAARSANPDAGPAAPSSLAERLTRAEPVTVPELRGYGANVDLQLIDLARDANRPLPLRRAATRGLGLVATRTARDYLGRVIAAAASARTENDLALLRTAVLSLGALRDDAALGQLTPLLGHRDPEIRLDAVAAIAAARLPSSIDILESYVRLEKDARLRKKAAKQLRVLKQSVDRPEVAPPPAPRVVTPRSIHERGDLNRPPERGP